jgi:hypothetical protein
LGKNDIVEIEKGVYTLREKLSRPIVKISLDEPLQNKKAR